MAEPNKQSAAADLEEARENLEESTRDKAGKTFPSADYSFEAMKKVEVEKVFVLSFRTLQLKRIAEMQDELLHLTFGSASPQTPNKEEVDAVLSNYTRALRNYETLSRHAQPSIPNDAKFLGVLAKVTDTVKDLSSRRHGSYGVLVNLPFINLYKSYRRLTFREADILTKMNAVLEVLGKSSLPSAYIERLETSTGRLGFRELDQKGREERSQKKAFTQRIIMAMFGGAALIGPMLIMTLHPSRNTSLVTVSIATFLFALVLAFIARDSAGKDVLAATAAYAAVLVVFVGTSMTPTS